jgi:CheY-like chemotaxis protein
MPTVLVVDDEEPLRLFMARVLEDEGYQVLLAENGVEALDLLAQPSPRIDLVVTDVLMPRMTGPELVARLAAQRSQLRVLFVSGGHDRSDVAGPVLWKPFLPNDLSEMARLLLMEVAGQTGVLESCGSG